MSTGRSAPKPRQIEVALPRELGFLLEMHRYKVAYGGRYGTKTRSFAIALLTLGSAQKLRILCCREVMNSIRDSVHQELKIVIEAMGLGSFYTVLDTEIRGRNGTVFIFSGLAGHTVDSIKSYSGIDVAWVEEAQNVKKRSWDILIPTIRAPNSEIWVSFNPDMDTDDTWMRFIERKPPGAMVVKMGWQQAQRAGWWTDTMEAERLHCLKTDPTGYPNIWEGQPKTVVTGAIYAREVLQMVEEGRIRAIPYDPRLPVHTVWDLGWNDAMTIIMVQKPTHNSINVVNYLEDSFMTYAQYVADLSSLKYVWGTDWLPHDAENRDPKSGTNAKLLLRGLGRKVKVIPRDDVEEGIKAARMMFPRVYIDDTARERATGYLGAKRLIECLKRYRRNVPSGTGEPSTPVHDEYAHGADAWRYLAMIVDQIRNDADIPPPVALPEYSNPVRGMGMLG